VKPIDRIDVHLSDLLPVQASFYLLSVSLTQLLLEEMLITHGQLPETVVCELDVLNF
jgi:hypothetical protein